jgi:hypothetical protein
MKKIHQQNAFVFAEASGVSRAQTSVRQQASGGRVVLGMYFGDFGTLGNLFSGFRDFGKPISWISGLWEIPIFGIEGPLWDRIWDHYGAIFRISHIVGPSVGPLWDIVWDHCGAIVGPIVGLIG